MISVIEQLQCRGEAIWAREGKGEEEMFLQMSSRRFRKYFEYCIRYFFFQVYTILYTKFNICNDFYLLHILCRYINQNPKFLNAGILIIIYLFMYDLI